MRRVVILAPLLIAVACKGGAGSAEAPPPPAPREHPLAQDGSTARGITSMPDKVKVQLDLAVARAAVQAYRAEKNAWPQTLSELRIEGLNYPADLTWDPNTGVVGSLTYPTF